jgi:lactate racemase
MHNIDYTQIQRGDNVAERIIKLPWSNDEIAIKLPARWNIAGILEPQVLPAVADMTVAVRGSLQQPVGMEPLHDLVAGKPGLSIALVIDDGSRPTPVAQILPPVLSELEQAGVKREQITLIPATGMHRTMDVAEVAQRAGPVAVAGLRHDTHDCDDMSRLVNLGVTSRGTPVFVNKVVALSDLVISIGCIEPHIIASFGGGYKNLVPGVAGRMTVAHNHSLNCSPATFNMVGQPY